MAIQVDVAGLGPYMAVLALNEINRTVRLGLRRSGGSPGRSAIAADSLGEPYPEGSSWLFGPGGVQSAEQLSRASWAIDHTYDNGVKMTMNEHADPMVPQAEADLAAAATTVAAAAATVSAAAGAAASEIAVEGSTVTEPQRKVSGLFLTLFTLLNFGLMFVVMMPALFTLPYKVGQLAPDNKVAILGIVATIGAVVSLVAGPIAGVLSDRTRTRIGRRRPWLIGGILVLAVGSTIAALAPSVPVLIVGWVVISVGGAGAAAGVAPIVAERIPEAQRGLASALAGVATQLAGVFGYTIGGLLTSNVLLLFLLPVIVLAVFGTAFMLLVREPLIDLPQTSVAETFRALVFNPRKYPDVSFAWLGKLFMQITLAFLSTYQLYFLLDRLGFTAESAGANLALVGGIGIIVTMSFAVVSGILSDRLRRRKPFIYVSTLLAATGMILMAFTNGFGLFFAAVMFVLGSAGMFGSVDVAMASDLVPQRDQAGRWMSIYGVAVGLGSALAPVLGAALLTIGSSNATNYTLLFLVGAVIAVGTAVATFFVKSVR
jgi:MFS family permease